MKTIKLLVVFAVLSFTGSAQNLTPYQKLVSVNAEWANHPEVDLSDIDVANLHSDEDWIQQHLFLVHQSLSKVDVSNLNEAQRRNREKSLKDLLGYAINKEFPQNRSYVGRRPVFIDHRGVHCAVGYLIKKSENSELSNRISQNMNYDYLRDMQDDGLNKWVQQSGFSLAELAWIQPGYFQPVNFEPMKGGVNGRVNAIVSDNNLGLFVGGDFDTAGQGAAGSMANYINGFAGFDWMKVGNTGFAGVVNDFIYFKGELYVAGNFYMVDSVYVNSGVVKWDGNKWEAVGDFYVGALFNYVLDLEVYRDTLYAGGFFRAKSTVPEYFESIAKWDGTDWVNAGVNLTGEVRKMHVHDGKLVIGGNFQMNTGAPIQNAIMLDSTGVSFFGAGPGIAVNDIATYNNELYIATDFTNQAKTDTMGLAVYRNSKWEVLFDGTISHNFATGGIKALATSTSVNALIFGGDFSITPLVGNFGRNLGYLRGSSVSAYGGLDSTVRELAIINSSLFIGGDFVGYDFMPPGSPMLNHITKVDLGPTFSVKEVSKTLAVDIYPNPSDGHFIIAKDDNNWKDFSLSDLQGRTYQIEPTEHNEGWLFDISHLASGTYVISMNDGELKATKTVVIK